MAGARHAHRKRNLAEYEGEMDVDEQLVAALLRVHGIDGLRVVDASIMPMLPSANTYASTLAIAEKVADMIRGRLAPTRE